MTKKLEKKWQIILSQNLNSYMITYLNLKLKKGIQIWESGGLHGTLTWQIKFCTSYNCPSIYPSIYCLYPLIPAGSWVRPGASVLRLLGERWVCPGWLPVHHRDMLDKQLCTQTLIPKGTLKRPINPRVIFFTVEVLKNNPHIHRWNMQTPCRWIPVRESNQGPLFCKATVYEICILGLTIVISNVLALLFNWELSPTHFTVRVSAKPVCPDR